MNTLVLGLFKNSQHADEATDHLLYNNIDPDDISILMKNRRKNSTFREETAQAANEGLIGEIAALLIGINAINVPCIGEVLIGGPLSETAVFTDALGEGLAEGLISLGLSEDDAEQLEMEIEDGAILLVVAVTPKNLSTVRGVLTINQASDLKNLTIKESTDITA